MPRLLSNQPYTFSHNFQKTGSMLCFKNVPNKNTSFVLVFAAITVPFNFILHFSRLLCYKNSLKMDVLQNSLIEDLL